MTTSRTLGDGFWLAVSVLLAIPIPLRSGEKADDPDEVVLRQAKVGTDNASLLAFLRARSGEEAEEGHIRHLVRQLGIDAFKSREEASEKLLSLGRLALPALRAAVKSTNVEVASRAKECLCQLERRTRVSLELFAVRLLVRRQVPGAVEALLRYLPYETDEATQEEVWDGLDTLAGGQGKVGPALTAALRDVKPERRAVAACIIGRRGTDKERALVGGLLRDGDPWVRLRAAQGLLAARDRTAVPVLIALLREKNPLTLAWQAEELLSWVAGKDAPRVFIEEGAEATRQRAHQAWTRWWRSRPAQSDVFKQRRRHLPPRLLLLCEFHDGSATFRLCGGDGTIRWKRPRDRFFKDPPGKRKGKQAKTKGECPTQGKPVSKEEDRERSLRDLMLLCDPRSKRLPNGNLLLVENSSGPRAYGDVREKTPEGTILSRWSPWLRDSDSRTVTPLDNGNIFWASEEWQNVKRDEARWHAGEANPLTGEKIWAARFKDRIMPSLVLPGPGRTILVFQHGYQPVKVFEKDNGVFGERKDGPYRPAELLRINRRGETLGREQLSGITAGDVFIWRGKTILVGGGLDGFSGIVELTSEGKRVWEVLIKDSATGENVGIDMVRPCHRLVGFGFKFPDGAWDPDSTSERIKEVTDRDKDVRWRAVRALKRHGPKAVAAIPVLIEAFSDAAVSREVGGALTAIGPKGTAALVKALKDRRPSVRLGAAKCLGAVSRLNPAVLLPYMAALRDSNAGVREAAASQLGEFREKAVKAVPALIAALKDQDVRVAAAAAQALGRVRGDLRVVLPALLEALKDGKEQLRRAALAALGTMGPLAKPALPTLLSALDDPNWRAYREPIVRALGAMGPEAAPAVPALIAVVKRTEQDIQEAAIRALGKIGPSAKDAVPVLLEALEARKSYDPDPVFVALGQIGPGAKAAIPTLVKLQSGPFKREATDALKQIRGK